jgi:tetratricopeptide (TPR) repeat protein
VIVAIKPIDELKKALETPGQVIAVVAAGFALNSLKSDTPEHARGSWQALILDALKQCELSNKIPILAVDKLGTPKTRPWTELMQDNVNSGDLTMMLSAAQSIREKLGEGDFASWLASSVGGLKNALRDPPEAILALHALGVPIITTNYDDLIEYVTKRQPITWQDSSAVDRTLRGDTNHVLHIHGYFERPESVILTLDDYSRVKSDAHTQAVMRAMVSNKTYLFIGCGGTLDDPNFELMLSWFREAFANLPYKHFRLELKHNVASVQASHPDAERIQVLEYGTDYDDLAGFLRSLAPITSTPAVADTPATTPALSSWKPLEQPDARFGGQDKLNALVTALLETNLQPVLVQGLAGIGKSNLCEHGLNNEAVGARFGTRRAFVRCDAATNRENLVAQIASEIAVQPGPNLEPRVLAELEREPCVIVLDNLETPWLAETLPVERLLKTLSGLNGVALVGGVRGGSRPVGLRWVSIQPETLVPEDAKALFLEFSERHFESDPNLDELLGRLDGLPLAIKLLALRAQGDPDLSGLLRRYDAKRSDSLHQGVEKARSLPVSLELSFESFRMSDTARAGASVLAMLPDGVLHSDLNDVLEDGDEVAHTLRTVGLAFDREGRLRMLAPVREHVSLAHPSGGVALERAVQFYCDLILVYGPHVGRLGGARAVERLGPEFANASEMVLRALEVDEKLAVRAATHFSDFCAWTGLEAMQVMIKVLETTSDHVSVQDLIQKLGEIALQRSNHEVARDRFNQALTLYKQVGDVMGEANCIQGLGQIALERTDHAVARDRFKQALTLFQLTGDVMGEANCIQRLGQIAMELSDQETAWLFFKQALPLHKRVENILGEANCIQGLGDIEFRRSNLEVARLLFEGALSLYKHIGIVLGEANCIQGLGNIALERTDQETAQLFFEQALPLHKRVGDVLGEANCIQGLGDVALKRTDRDSARIKYFQALELFTRIPERFSMGKTNLFLSKIARDNTEYEHHIAEARRLWLSINRPDLIEEFLPPPSP